MQKARRHYAPLCGADSWLVAFGSWLRSQWPIANCQLSSREARRSSDFLDASHFRVYFIPLSGYFSPFPHGTIRYRSLHFFSLGWWSTRIRAGLHVSDLTQEIPTVRHPFDYGALTLSGRPFQDRSSRVTTIGYWAPTTPRPALRGGQLACGFWQLAS